MKDKFKILLFIFFLISVLFLPNLAFAQDNPYGVNDMDLALDQGLEPRSAIINIINIALGFLGLISVIIIIYGGFVWMTSGGSADKVAKAKKILINGLIGLALILLSWGIATFIFNFFSDGSSTTSYSTPRDPFDPGFGALGNCTLESVYPEPGQKDVPRNTSIIVTFKEELDSASVCVNTQGGDDGCDCNDDTCGGFININHIQIFKNEEGNNLATNLSNAKAILTADKKTILIIPNEWLGSPDGYTDYSIRLLSLKKEDGDLMFKTCSADWYQWSFEVSNKVDLEPPRIVSNGIFPPPDDEKDTKTIINSVAATGSITVNSKPTFYQAAKINSVLPVADSGSVLSYSINDNYNLSFTELNIVADENFARLTDNNGNPLEVTTWVDNTAIFSDFFNLTLEVDSYEEGNSWEINLSPQVLADNLTIGNQVYSFTEDGVGLFEIKVSDPYDNISQAENIYNKILANSSVNVSRTDNSLDLTAKVGGASGNNINLSSTNPTALNITPMSGGVNKGVSYTINDKPDQPMNTTIQINFNKAMNPITLSGSSSDVKDYIRVVRERQCGENVSFIYNGELVTYGTIEKNGMCWLDRNLGAEPMPFNPAEHATGNTDERLYGDLFQWGRAADGHQLINWTSETTGNPVHGTTDTLADTDQPDHEKFITTSSLPNDWRDDNNNGRWNASPIVNNPCPPVWRVSTLIELQNISSEWSGFNDAFNSSFKLPVPGFRLPSGGLHSVGLAGYFWSVRPVNNSSAVLRITNSGVHSLFLERARGFSVRCISDSTSFYDIVDGDFNISNGYRTVEFVSDFECGVNACGGKIYCLPSNSNIEVQLVAANLIECGDDADCFNYQPFANCNNTALTYDTCQNADGENYPTANIMGGFDGIMDTSFNSFDGNRSETADGPISFFNQNNPDDDDGDNYKWSFFTTDEINLDPPKIVSIKPNQGDDNVDLKEPIEAKFDTLMRNSTLRTGFTNIPDSEGNNIRHNRINLRSLSHSIGYWIRTENIDTNNSGSLDSTKVFIRHSGLPAFSSWRPQIGSGVENIYQNCYKPSAGPECEASPEEPSCCFGITTDNLDPQGNCP